MNSEAQQRETSARPYRRDSMLHLERTPSALEFFSNEQSRVKTHRCVKTGSKASYILILCCFKLVIIPDARRHVTAIGFQKGTDQVVVMPMLIKV